ncbi:ADP-ribosylation factor like protein 2a [Spironucleus salmonicida]|uniref:ADP-ribosylation factor n=1 Tax=Spironucleus salmonicida TaxID=348837 RepID=V6LMC6_9EUKA|nr:ADP-ribosylation factor like protein 2a [Spironucleus salmonicida]|eukprot:EST41869.1 ADP-ribosylation factor [Spironucleus salmonicida]
MGLFDFFKRFRTPQKQHRLLILGLDNAGKTTLLKSLCGEDASLIQPTQGFNAKSVTFNKQQLLCYDVGGQKAIRSFWQNYFAGTTALIFVVDAADPKRLEEVAVELSICCEDAKLAGVPLLVFANKQDLGSALKPSEICDKLGLWAIRDHPWQIQGCSGVSGEGVEDGFRWICEKTG